MWKKLGQSFRENRMREKLFTWKAWATAQVLSFFWLPMPLAEPLQWWWGGGEWRKSVNRTRMLPQPMCKMSICKIKFYGLTRDQAWDYQFLFPNIHQFGEWEWNWMFIDPLFLNEFRFIEKLQRWYEEFPYIFLSVSSNVNILHCHNTFIKTKTVTLVRYY